MPVQRGRALEDMLRFVVQALVDHPEDVQVELVADEDGEVFQVQANPEDLGRLIGRNGQTAKALQTIVNANGKRDGRRYHLDILEGDEGLEDD